MISKGRQRPAQFGCHFTFDQCYCQRLAKTFPLGMKIKMINGYQVVDFGGKVGQGAILSYRVRRHVWYNPVTISLN
jgi:hypothetical protein